MPRYIALETLGYGDAAGASVEADDECAQGGGHDTLDGCGRVQMADGFAVGGFAPFSTVDWPGMMTATVFAQGCGWRCRYCHNPSLLRFRRQNSDTHEAGAWTWPSVRDWLRDRRGLLDAVVFSGGEPTLQPGLPGVARAVRELGFRVGLHTGGPRSQALAAALPWVDWVWFDFKAMFANYARVTGRADGEAASESLRLLLAAGVALEVRTTWHPQLLGTDELGAMADTLAACGVAAWVIQRFRTEGCADQELCRAEPEEVPWAGLARPGLTVRVRG